MKNRISFSFQSPFLALACLSLLALPQLLMGKPGSHESQDLLDLPGVERLAAEHSLEMRNARIDRAIAKERAEARFREYFPSLSVSYRQNRTVAQRDFDNGLYSVQVSASQPIYDGGRSSLRYEMSKIDQKLARDRSELLRDQIRYKAREAYIGLQQAVASLSIAKASVTRSSRLLEKSSMEYERGMITELDYLEIQNQHDRNLLEVDAQKRRLSVAAESLYLATGLAPASFRGIRLLDLEHTTFRQLEMTADELAALAIDNHPEVVKARLSLYRARKEYLITKQYYLPTVSLTARYGKTGETWPPTTSEWGFGINFTFRGFDSTLSNDVGINRSRGGTSEGITSGGQLDLLNDMERESSHLANTKALLQAQRTIEDLRKTLPLRARILKREYSEKLRGLELARRGAEISKKRFFIDLLRYERGEISLEEYNEEELRFKQSMQSLAEQQSGLVLFIANMELELGLNVDRLNLLELNYLSARHSEQLFDQYLEM